MLVEFMQDGCFCVISFPDIWQLQGPRVFLMISQSLLCLCRPSIHGCWFCAAIFSIWPRSAVFHPFLCYEMQDQNLTKKIHKHICTFFYPFSHGLCFLVIYIVLSVRMTHVNTLSSIEQKCLYEPISPECIQEKMIIISWISTLGRSLKWLCTKEAPLSKTKEETKELATQMFFYTTP